MNFPRISSKNGIPKDGWTPLWLKPWIHVLVLLTNNFIYLFFFFKVSIPGEREKHLSHLWRKVNKIWKRYWTRKKKQTEVTIKKNIHFMVVPHVMLSIYLSYWLYLNYYFCTLKLIHKFIVSTYWHNRSENYYYYDLNYLFISYFQSKWFYFQKVYFCFQGLIL